MGNIFEMPVSVTEIIVKSPPFTHDVLSPHLKPDRPPAVPGTRVYPLAIGTPETHTMGTSLFRYLQIKVHEAVLWGKYDDIIVIGSYNRYSPASIPFEGEKRDKPFNWERPTARREGSTLYIECFPGHDHVEHYSEIIACYLRLLEEATPAYNLTHYSRVSFIPSSCSDTQRALSNTTNLNEFPGEGVDAVILGMVWHLPNLTGAEEWQGAGPWQWIVRPVSSGLRVGFLGFRPAFWGDIAGEVIHWLTSRFSSIKEIIYLGKLGVLRKGVKPNAWLATGDKSLVNGRVVAWGNCLERAIQIKGAHSIISGSHVTLGSVLHETKEWHKELEGVVDFVDPEIGMMAQAAVRSGIRFGYLHMITDNLGQKYEEDLSNERTLSVLKGRARLHQVVRDVMEEHLGTPV